MVALGGKTLAIIARRDVEIALKGYAHMFFIANDSELYFGVPIEAESLTPHGHAPLGAVRYDDWLSKNVDAQ